MHIAIYGPGAIGSTFAFYLGRAGHAVTVVARGARLEHLRREAAIVRASGERVPIEVRDALDPSAAYDLVLVTLLAPQVDAVLPALRASTAKQVMFMFNTFESIAPLRDAVGAERFAFGFPAGVFTLLVDGVIHETIRSGTTVSDPAWAHVFSAARIPTVVEKDMQSFLRAHAAMVVPLMAIGVRVVASGHGVSWSDARTFALAMRAGFRIVRAVGSRITPASVAMIGGLPTAIVTALLWMMSRTKVLRDLGVLGPAEPRTLIDMMSKAVPSEAAPIRAIRP